MDDEVVADKSTLPKSYFLAKGGKKVMRCAQLLADLINSDHSPAVTRQAIRCAKLFFNLVDLNKIKS